MDTKPRFSIYWLFAASVVFFVLGWFLSSGRDDEFGIVQNNTSVVKWNKKTGEVWFSVGRGNWVKYPPHQSQKRTSPRSEPLLAPNRTAAPK